MLKREKSHQLYQEIITKTVDYIVDNLHEPLDLKQLAFHANLSPYHFHRVFKHIQEETPYNFIRRCRVEKAAQLIRSGEKLFLQQIAYDCGFTNQSMFVKTFRKYYGVSPHAYRKLNQTK